MNWIARFRLLQYFVLIAVFGLFYGSVRTTVDEIIHAVDSRVSNMTRLEEASRFYLEYLNLFVALEDLVHGAPGASAENVALTYDLLWARTETLSSVADYKVVQDLDTENKLFKEVQEALRATEPMFANVNSIDMESARFIQDRFARAGPMIRAFAEAAYEKRLKKYLDIAQAQRTSTKWLGMVNLAFLAIGLLTPLLLAGEVYRVRRLNNEIKQREAQVIKIGMTDMLTGLGNRRALVAELQETRMASAWQGFLILLDLDEFKPVNDTFGHQVGDQLLAEAAGRLKCVSEKAGCKVYRLGGDEFAILANEKGAATELAAKLIAEMERSFFIGGREINISASAGIAVNDAADLTDAQRLIGNADVALYEAKRTGRCRAVWFETGLRETLNFRNIIASDLLKAVEAGEIDVCYQPQFSVTEQRIVGVEALARWHHPTLGQISPDVFIREAERQGIIRNLDLAVLKKACAEIRRLNQAGADLRLSVNVSPLEAGRTGYSDDLIAIVEDARFPKNRLTMELTENILMEDYDAVARNLEHLALRGFQTAIDDFGAGYSNLGYLARFRFSYLKVDKSVAEKLNNSPRYKQVLAGITQLAKDMELKVVLEGVENDQQFDAATGMGIAFIQGYYVSRPLTFEGLEQFVKGGWVPPQSLESRTAA